VKVAVVVELDIDVLVSSLSVSGCLDVLQRAVGLSIDGERRSKVSNNIRVKLG
jgi:hypothetical protein